MISLVLFLVYIFADMDSLKVVTLVGLLITAVLGIAMFVMWLGGIRTRAVSAGVNSVPKDHFPTPIVALHGIAAVATLILYIVAAFVVAS